MITGKETTPGRILFSYSKCYGLSCYHITVDKEWFYAQDLEHLSAEELDKLAHEDRVNSNVEGIIRWYGD